MNYGDRGRLLGMAMVAEDGRCQAIVIVAKDKYRVVTEEDRLWATRTVTRLYIWQRRTDTPRKSLER